MCDFSLDLSTYASSVPMAAAMLLFNATVMVLCAPIINMKTRASMHNLKKELEKAEQRREINERAESLLDVHAQGQESDVVLEEGDEGLLFTRQERRSVAEMMNPQEMLDEIRGKILSWRGLCLVADFDDDPEAQAFLRNEVAKFKIFGMTLKPYIAGLSVCCVFISLYLLIVSTKISSGVKRRWKDDGLEGVVTGADLLVVTLILLPVGVINALRPSINTIIKYADDSNGYQPIRRFFAACFYLSIGMLLWILVLAYPLIVSFLYFQACGIVASFMLSFGLVCGSCCIIPVLAIVWKLLKKVVSIVLSPLNCTEKENELITNIFFMGGFVIGFLAMWVCVSFLLIGGPTSSRVCLNLTELWSSSVYIGAQPVIFGVVGYFAQKGSDRRNNSRDQHHDQPNTNGA